MGGYCHITTLPDEARPGTTRISDSQGHGSDLGYVRRHYWQNMPAVAYTSLCNGVGYSTCTDAGLQKDKWIYWC
jgi:hypothetical protein